MPAHDLALLTHAARAAGDIALRFWRQSPDAWEKPDGTGPVTEADLAVNAMLRDTLQLARPDYGWLSEEDADTTARLSTPRQFIIDPIDGTRAFMAGEEAFAHSLAVTENGTVIAGVVYLPALDRLYTATATGPALKDGEPISASLQTEIEGATLLTTPPNLAPQHWTGGVPDVKRSFRTSLAYRLCLVAEGRHDGMLTLRDAGGAGSSPRPSFRFDVTPAGIEPKNSRQFESRVIFPPPIIHFFFGGTNRLLVSVAGAPFGLAKAVLPTADFPNDLPTGLPSLLCDLNPAARAGRASAAAPPPCDL